MHAGTLARWHACTLARMLAAMCAITCCY